MLDRLLKGLEKRDQEWFEAVEQKRVRREKELAALSHEERVVRAAKEAANAEANFAKTEATFQKTLDAVFWVGKSLLVISVVVVLLTNPVGIFWFLPLFIAIWGIQLLTRR